MATGDFGYDSSILTNLLTNAFNDVLNAKAIDVISQRNGFLYAILGRDSRSKIEPGPFKYERLQKVSGIKKEVRFMGKFATIAAVTNGTNEMADWDLSFAAPWASIEYDLTHFPWSMGVPESEIRKCAGSEAKTESLAAEYMQYCVKSWEHTLGTALSSATLQSNAAIGGWQYYVSDGISTGETGYNLYGAINRGTNETGNIIFRSTVTPNVGELTLPVLDTAIAACRANGGYPDIAPCAAAVWVKVKQLLGQQTIVNYDATWSRFGSDWLQFGPTKFILDPYQASGVLGILDSSTFDLWMNEDGFTGGFKRADWTKAGYMISMNSWIGHWCNNPKVNAKITGISTG